MTQKYLFPFKEDLCRFDFEVNPEDEYMCSLGAMAKMGGTPSEVDKYTQSSY